MLEFSKIDRDFSIYRKNQVYLFGASAAGAKVKTILEKNGIHVRGIVDNDEKKRGSKFYGTGVISFSDFAAISKKEQDLIVQIASTYEREIAEQLEKNGIRNYIFYTEFVLRIAQLGRYLIAEKDDVLKNCFYENDWTRTFLYTMDDLQNDYLEKKKLLQTDTFDFMLSPPKVGNDTIYRSFKKNNRFVINFRHSYKFLDEKIHEVLKRERMRLIIGVREPVKQNLSIMFEISGNEFWDLDEFWEAGGNVQKIFDNYIIGKNDSVCWYNIFKERMHYDYLVQNFFEQQLEPFLGIDIYQYPFDKVNGYSVYHFDRIDLFVYQMERLTDVFGELAKFLDAEGTGMSITNDAKSKWYNEYYKKAQKDIVISGEYFEACYSGKYIKHFYSDEDIAKFKNAWKNNVR